MSTCSMSHARGRGCRVARRARLALLLFGVVLAGTLGCDSKTYLMPTPNIYTNPAWDPFADVPEALQSDTVSVLYVTDRAPSEKGSDTWPYGSERSRSAAFGEAVMRIGEGETWQSVVAASRSKDRPTKLQLSLNSVRELARFGKQPPTLVVSDAQLASDPPPTPVDPVQVEAERQFRAALSARLAKTPRKEVFLYVHGFNNSFEDAALSTGQLWHFLGREGVPVCYSWPAGIGGLRAYEYTLASTEFTIHHFKQTLRLIASCPEVERVNIIAHSRGTAVATDGIRELHLEIRGTADTRATLKLGTLVLAASDIDLDVMIARNATERIGRAVERTVLYISKEDKALSLSNWLFGGASRVGNLDAVLFDRQEIEVLRHSHHLQLIDAQVEVKDALGHSYFYANPAVSSDIILLIRFGLLPGRAHGRPLGVSEMGIWALDDAYPGADWTPPAAHERIDKTN